MYSNLVNTMCVFSSKQLEQLELTSSLKWKAKLAVNI